MNDFDAKTQQQIADGLIVHLGDGWFKGTNPTHCMGEWAEQQEVTKEEEEAWKLLDSQTKEGDSK